MMREPIEANAGTRKAKLQTLPKGVKVHKRPLLRAAIPSPFTGSSSRKTIYVSPRTPFISAVKRVRHLLSLIENRAAGPSRIGLLTKDDAKQRDPILLKNLVGEKRSAEAVYLRGSGRAIEKCLGLGTYFMGQGDVSVQVTTGSELAVDDLTKEDEAPRVDDDETMNDDEPEDEEKEEIPESRMRYTSFVEVEIRLA